MPIAGHSEGPHGLWVIAERAQWERGQGLEARETVDVEVLARGDSCKAGKIYKMRG